ncbi:MAG: cytochrome c family protein [candidate division KSB1 bacterium]|nr:cytochrome c family protein [candidate division KSB1 bacterium]MDZ7367579.1 cytochrome c family protein [candidate division KSB1 bacterium]MDZ7405371.1 cytochrome c family protein [candidate division KSB1 bacterium]
MKRTTGLQCSLGIALALGLAACENPESTKLPTPPVVSTPKFKISDFTAPEQCAPCHPNHYNEWRSSMHAYAFVDPVFFAMHERGQKETNGRLDQFCTKCHSPIASLTGETPPFFNRQALSPISKQGVQCDVCHTITKINKIANADFELTPGNTKYGSLADPVPNSFHQSAFNAIFDRSEICGVCHEVRNDLGAPLEETYSEWASSALAGMAVDCQDCHMPTYAGQAATGGPQREKVHRHYFAGVDVPLVDFPDADLQRQMAEELLKSAAELKLVAPPTARAGDTLRLMVTIANLRAGHNLPTGVTAERQMWLAVTARDQNGRLLYQSGQLDANGDLLDHHSVLAPSADADLTIFRQIMRDESGREVLFFWQAKTVTNNLIPPFGEKSATYKIPLPAVLSGEITLEVILRFRSLQPYFLRELGLADLVARVPIVDMAKATQRIAIN